MTEELLPCPFCGGEAKIIDNVRINRNYCVECSNKSCRFISSDYMTIKEWNTRYQPKYKRVDLDKEKIADPVTKDHLSYSKIYNEALDVIKSKYGDLYVEVK